MIIMFDWLMRLTRIIRVHGNLIVIIFGFLAICDMVKEFGGFREFIKYVWAVEDSCEGEEH